MLERKLVGGRGRNESGQAFQGPERIEGDLDGSGTLPFHVWHDHFMDRLPKAGDGLHLPFGGRDPRSSS